MQNSKLTRKQFNLIIIGSGGAGSMAAIEEAKNGVTDIAVISKVIPTSSHTVAAKGGINAALGNVVADDWKWHAYDTIKGSDYLADSDGVDLLCKNAADAIIELEKMGVVFSRTTDGLIAQRAYGGQTLDYGNGAIAYRACYSKDKTGQTILHTLYAQALNLGIEFYSEFFVTDLFIEQNQCNGCLAIDLANGELFSFESANTIIASGGYSQIFRNTTSSLICTGDGSALVLKEGLPLQDMEFIQFHPTGIANQGFLITEAARGEGAYLLNAQGERFMKNYAPKMMELSSRDLISRAIAHEIIAGRGCGSAKDHVYLDLRHLDKDVLLNKLPGVVEIAKNFAKIDVFKEMIPVAPTAHYTMGGIPTNINCEVLDSNMNSIAGLMAVGETACVSVHGANRLGCNSLLDLIVFGKIAGKNMASKQQFGAKLNEKFLEEKIHKFEQLLQKNAAQNSKSLQQIKNDLQNCNEKYLGVFRNQDLLQSGYDKLSQLFLEFKNYSLKNKNLLWNDELVSYFELENLFLNSFAAVFSAINRRESRGAHYREDYPAHDDENFKRHSLVKLDEMGKLVYFTRKLR